MRGRTIILLDITLPFFGLKGHCFVPCADFYIAALTHFSHIIRAGLQHEEIRNLTHNLCPNTAPGGWPARGWVWQKEPPLDEEKYCYQLWMWRLINCTCRMERKLVRKSRVFLRVVCKDHCSLGNTCCKKTLFLSLGRWGGDCTFLAAFLSDAAWFACRLYEQWCYHYNSGLTAVTAANVAPDWRRGISLVFWGLEVLLLGNTVKSFCLECHVSTKLQCIYWAQSYQNQQLVVRETGSKPMVFPFLLILT